MAAKLKAKAKAKAKTQPETEAKAKTQPKAETEAGAGQPPEDYSRWAEPFWVDTNNMTPEELARSEAFDEAHRAALRGDFEPGIKLGLFPKDMKKP